VCVTQSKSNYKDLKKLIQDGLDLEACPKMFNRIGLGAIVPQLDGMVTACKAKGWRFKTPCQQPFNLSEESETMWDD
jgi:hypothetical protein